MIGVWKDITLDGKTIVMDPMIAFIKATKEMRRCCAQGRYVRKVHRLSVDSGVGRLL